MVAAGQEAAWPATVLALLALVAEAAEGTVPSWLRLMLAPVSEALATLEPLTAPLAILPVVTDFDLSWREPTEFLPSCGGGERLSAGESQEQAQRRDDVGVGETVVGAIVSHLAVGLVYSLFLTCLVAPLASYRRRIMIGCGSCGVWQDHRAPW